MSGEQQLRAFVERILRLKEEQDTLAADIREIYAEAKGSGFDKTAMGQLVAHLRKVEKVGVAAVEEGQTVFDLYLDAYRRATGTGVATHTHEAIQSYAEQKGRGYVDAKLVATVAAGMQTEIGHKALLVAVDAMIEAEEITDETVTQQAIEGDDVAENGEMEITPFDPETGEITEHEEPETATQSGLINEVRTDAHGLSEAGTLHQFGVAPAESAPDEISAPHSNPQPTSSPEADKTGEAAPLPASPVEVSDDDVPAFLRKERKPLRPHCLRPELCGSGTRDHCYSCKKAMAGSEAA